MKSFLFCVFLLSLSVLYVSCDKDEVVATEEKTSEGRVHGTIHGVISDAVDNKRLENVKVTYAAHDSIKHVNSGELGYYTIIELYPGDYELSYSNLEGYAITKKGCVIPNINEVGFGTNGTVKDFYYNRVLNIDLFPLNATLTGKVYVKLDEDHVEPAAQVKLIVDYTPYDLSPNEYSVITDENGSFTISGLPAASPVGIRTLPYAYSGKSFSVYQRSDEAVIANDTRRVEDIILTIAPAEPFVIENNISEYPLPLTDNIVLTFSKEMDPNSFDISLSSMAYGDVELAESWSDNITLTLDPYVALQANEEYRLVLSGYSADHNFYSETYDFKTQEGIEFVKTNLERIDGKFDQFPIDQNIEIYFSMNVNGDFYDNRMELYDEENAEVAIDVSVSGSMVTVDPLYPLEPYQDYKLYYKIYSNMDGDFESGNIDFQTAPEVSEAPRSVNTFTLNMSDDWKADWNTTSMRFRWTNVDYADYYKIYAKDNNKNTDLIVVAETEHNDNLIEQSGSVDISAFEQFDYYESDDVYSPFLFNTELKFFVTAVNDYGESQISEAVTIRDRTSPICGAEQEGSADNSNNMNNSKTIKIKVSATSGEYLDYTHSPVINISGAGQPNEYVIPLSDLSLEWSEDLKTLIIKLLIPKGKNAVGNMIFINDIQDSNGNKQKSPLIYGLQ